MSYGEDDWFQYTNEFNRPADSPGGAGQYNFEPGNIDNIPLNDDAPLSPGQGLDFDLTVPLDEYQYEPLRLSPGHNNGQHHQQPGTSGNNDMGAGGQFQNMHIMQNTDSFEQHMQQSSSIEYNSFEMPTVISSNHEVGPFQDLGIDDPNSYYANQEPSTSQGNDMIMGESYEMMGQQQSYIPQMDQMNPSSVGNPSSHSNMSQQMHPDMNSQMQPQQKPKPKKSRPANKKKPAGVPGGETVGTVLTKVNKITQQIGSNEGPGQKVEARVSAEDSIRIGQLMANLTRLQSENGNGIDNSEEIGRLQSEIAQVFQNSMVVAASTNTSQNSILTQIQSLTQPTPSTSSNQSMGGSQQPKKAPPKRIRNNNQNNIRNVQQQQQQQQQQQHQMPQQMQSQIPQAQMTPAKIVMEPPTATMVPSSSHSNQNMNFNGGETYMVYAPHDQQQQGPSQQPQKQYVEYQQPLSHDSMQQRQHPQQHHQNHMQQQQQPQTVLAKIVPSMDQRTHTYRQAVIYTSNSNGPNGPGPSPQLRQPQSHDSQHHQMSNDHQQFHQQDQGPPSQHSQHSQHSQQMYVPMHQHQQDDRSQPQQMYQQEVEPTLGDMVRQTTGRYQGPQDAPNLRQQLLTNVNASSKQMQQQRQVPTSSPMQPMPYTEVQQHHNSYPQSIDSMQQPHSQLAYDHHSQNQFDNGMDEYYDMSMQQSSQMMQPPVSQQQQIQHQYEPQEMYEPQIMEPLIDLPQPTIELTEEEVQERIEERRQDRERKLKEVLLDQLESLEAPVDTTPFSGKIDMFKRMLPFHHLSNGEEPVSDFDSKFEKTMKHAVSHANALGNRVRSIVLRDSMKRSTEWEENMLLFMDTESERRKLLEDRKMAEVDPIAFLQGSEIIQHMRTRRLHLEKTRRIASTFPNPHLEDLDTANGQYSLHYKEYEFDSYDENRPRGSPLVYEPPETESESETEPEPEPFEELKVEERVPTRSDLSPIAGYPPLSPIPSPSRSRNESESTADWKDESPMLSPEMIRTTEFRQKIALANTESISKLDQHRSPRKPLEILVTKAESSSDESSSLRNFKPTPSPKTRPVEPQLISPKHVLFSCEPSTSAAAAAPSLPPPAIPLQQNREEGSPEIDNDDYFISPPPKPIPVEEVAPIPLPVPIHMIKKEKVEEKGPLKLRIPKAVVQKVMEEAAQEEDNEVQEIGTVSRGPLKLKLNLKLIKSEEPSWTDGLPTPSKVTVENKEKSPEESPPPIFKTPLPTPLKNTAVNRKRRSEKIEISPPSKRNIPETSGFVTPKNGLLKHSEEVTPSPSRFLKTMTAGRKIVMKIGTIPRNINHFVTPRRDKMGNLHKNLSPTKDTRLTMKLIRKDGNLSVQFIEKNPEEETVTEGKEEKEEKETTKAATNGPSLAKSRPAPASRKVSVDAAKDKKNHITKSKTAYCNRFNIFANVPTSSTSKPSTSSTSATVNLPAAVPKPAIPVSLSTPLDSRPTTSHSASLFGTPPIAPKITITAPEATPKPKLKSLLPWESDNDDSPEQRQKKKPSQTLSIPPSTSKDLLKVKTEPAEFVESANQQESPRASSSLSMSFFEDDKANGFSFLRSPKRTNEPLPVVEYSDDEENDLAHSTFSHAADHLIGTATLNNPVNGGAPSIFPWSTDP